MLRRWTLCLGPAGVNREHWELTGFPPDAHPRLLSTAAGRLRGRVLLFSAVILKINCWPAGSLTESKWTAPGFTLLWRRGIFSSDLESHMGNDWHVFQSSQMEMKCHVKGIQNWTRPEGQLASTLLPSSSSVTLGPAHLFRPCVFLT